MYHLVVDIGNSQIFFGVFKDNKLIFTFRKNSKTNFTLDEIGIYLINIFNYKKITRNNFYACSIASVVPHITPIIYDSIVSYIKPKKIYILGPGIKTGINIKYKNPHEVGADRIANCIGAKYLYGNNKSYIIVDIGTATTFDIINDKNEYFGGLIMPGPNLQIYSLSTSTAKLSQVELIKPKNFIIDNTTSAIQNGIYYLNLYGIKGLTEKIKKEFLNNSKTFVIGTGGAIKLFEGENIFDIVNQDLILWGLYNLIELNETKEAK
ncbi:MAG: type III pantothenate kinase [Elusimicrobiales bacterium]|nr:type III pantothenate kinase [Elusimicrobiales bacterium]